MFVNDYKGFGYECLTRFILMCLIISGDRPIASAYVDTGEGW